MTTLYTVRHTGHDHSFMVEGPQGLPPSARETDEPRVYEITDAVDCSVCNPPEQAPTW
ncbi:MAG: hypothetical protein M3P51_13490 [Chloroflexota bacterium]|nr:hypothetical protein [Chloroflexota bacterium]